MRVYSFLLLIALFSLLSCNQNNKPATVTNDNKNHPQTKASGEINSTGEFDFDKIAVSSIEIGDFPFLVAPEGYKYAGEKEKRMEEKYFFYNDTLIRKVSGRYFHTTVFKEGDTFEDSFVVNEFKKNIEELGGIEIFSGGLPLAAWDLISIEKPNYVADMYDPIPYKYKQFLIKKQNENIWIELCHGLNAHQIDLTVVREENKK